MLFMDTDKLIKFMQYVNKLKNIKRAGWIERKIENPESIADHSFRTAVMAMIFAKKNNLDENKLIKMALVHDIAESIVGDTISIPRKMDEKMKKEKFDKEEKAMRDIFSNLENGKEFIDLWLEYEGQETPEAKFLKEIDRLEMFLQVYDYTEENKNKQLDVFWTDPWQYNINSPDLKKIFDEIMKRRTK